MLDPTQYADWQIAEEAESTLPSVEEFRERLGILPEEIIPFGKTPKLDYIKIMDHDGNNHWIYRTDLCTDY